MAGLLLILLGLAFTAFIAVRMGRRINRPLQVIAQGVSQLQEGRLETACRPARQSRIRRTGTASSHGRSHGKRPVRDAEQHRPGHRDVRQNLETIEIQNIELDLARKARWKPAASSRNSWPT